MKTVSVGYDAFQGKLDTRRIPLLLQSCQCP